MDLTADIRGAESNPDELEQLYRAAVARGESAVFESALQDCYRESPDNLLYAAWYYRFREAPEAAARPRRRAPWITAVPLSALTGLIFWALSDVDSLLLFDQVPFLVLWWSPIAAMSALVFLALAGKKRRSRSLALGLGLLAAAAYVSLMGPALQKPWKIEQYAVLAAIHIPLLCWAALGVAALGLRSSRAERFAFLIKSIEVMITAGLYLIAGMILGGITVGMFAALGITLPEIWLRLIIAGGLGLLPVLAVASVYDPERPAAMQDFDQGLSRFIATMMRLMLPLILGVLTIYLFVIPFRFMQPFRNRDVLIVYNLLLFVVLGLLLGATPIRRAGVDPRLQKWLRLGIIAVAVLVELISLYALSATVFRTVQGGLTLNRMTIIGWNAINISILFGLLFKQFAGGQERWVESLQSVFGLGAYVYLAWSLFLLVAVPLLF